MHSLADYIITENFLANVFRTSHMRKHLLPNVHWEREGEWRVQGFCLLLPRQNSTQANSISEQSISRKVLNVLFLRGSQCGAVDYKTHLRNFYCCDNVLKIQVNNAALGFLNGRLNQLLFIYRGRDRKTPFPFQKHNSSGTETPKASKKPLGSAPVPCTRVTCMSSISVHFVSILATRTTMWFGQHSVLYPGITILLDLNCRLSERKVVYRNSDDIPESHLGHCLSHSYWTARFHTSNLSFSHGLWIHVCCTATSVRSWICSRRATRTRCGLGAMLKPFEIKQGG